MDDKERIKQLEKELEQMREREKQREEEQRQLLLQIKEEALRSARNADRSTKFADELEKAFRR